MLIARAGFFVLLGLAGAFAISPLVVTPGCTGAGSLTSGDGGLFFEGSRQSQTRFVEDGVPAEPVTWAGEPIEIKIDGVGISVNGGVDVVAEQGRTEVDATARLLAMAVSSEKLNADLTIKEVKDTFKITKAGSTITVACGHGLSHGTSSAGESGCEKVTVRIPAGGDTQPLSLTVLSGN